MRVNPEYILYRQIAAYLRLQYPHVMYHFDPTGLNLSKTQSGMLKVIQGNKGWPDLFIAEPRGKIMGLFIEIKTENTRLANRFGFPATPHIDEQQGMLIELARRGYKAEFACGFNRCKKIIDQYLNNKLQ